MKNYKGILTLALAGIAIGTVACYLTSTKEGKKILKNNKCCIKKLKKQFAKKSKKCSKKTLKAESNLENKLESITTPIT